MREPPGQMLGVEGVAAVMIGALTLTLDMPLHMLAQSFDARLDAPRNGSMAEDDMTLLLVQRH